MQRLVATGSQPQPRNEDRRTSSSSVHRAPLQEPLRPSPVPTGLVVPAQPSVHIEPLERAAFNFAFRRDCEQNGLRLSITADGDPYVNVMGHVAFLHQLHCAVVGMGGVRQVSTLALMILNDFIDEWLEW
jgi:hypothetical protein